MKKNKSNKTLFAVIIASVAVLILAAMICMTVVAVSFIKNDSENVDDEDNGSTVLKNNQFTVRILTDSMSPTFSSGDVIVCEEVDDPSELRLGDIICYWTVINGERVLNTHRIVNIYDGGGYLIFETKGDANTMADPLVVHESEIRGKYLYTSPASGIINAIEDLF